MTATAAPMRYLDRAIASIRSLGLTFEADAHTPAVALVQQLDVIDEGKALVIARTLQQSGHFNALVRDEISSARIGDRYEDIARSFDSVRDDAKRMVDQLDDGKIDFREKVSNIWMNVSRGTIPSRFQKIRSTYLEVAGDSKDQIDREDTILNAYMDFRHAIKEAEILASELLKSAEQRLNEAKQRVETATQAVTESDSSDRAAHGRLELARDEAIRELQTEDARYQVAKDLADNLVVSYNTSEVVMARLKQTTEVKRRVYQQSVAFFSTNETVFTALNSAFTAQQGLHESTQSLNAMKDGINKGLESIADSGDKLLSEGIKAGYGPTIQAESIKRLVDAVVDFQARSFNEIEEMRKLSTQNAKEISEAVEQGKQRYEALVTGKATTATAVSGSPEASGVTPTD